MRHLKSINPIGLMALCCAMPSMGGADGWTTVALGVGFASEFYEGDEGGIGMAPYLAHDTELFHIGLDGLRYNLIRDDALQVSVGLAPRFTPDFPDTELFSGLDREISVEGTVSAAYHFDEAFNVAIGFRHDLLSEHGGYELEFAVSHTVALGTTQLGLSVGARHRDENLNAYLVGVEASEANALRGAYEPGSTTSPFAGLSITQPLGATLALRGDIGVEYFGNAYRDSPLVTRRYSASIGAGIVYSF